jgi:aryl-alcohol dehydrogenase-like predicted oxidoreductase
MQKIKLANSNLEVSNLCLGGNVFGWTSNKEESFAVLDAFVAAGGNFIDTADVYSEWVEGNKGGESESILGEWMRARGNRSNIVIATKVAKYSIRPGLSSANIKEAIKESLERLQTNYIDLYWAHEDDTKVPLLETLQAFNELLTAGIIKAFGASNYSVERIKEAHEIAKANNLKSFTAIQNEYNMVFRSDYEKSFGKEAISLGLDQFPYYSLASGFLSGKYSQGSSVSSVRSGGVAKYQTQAGYILVDAIKEIAIKHNSNASAVSLAWLRAKNCVPIASARTFDQLKEIVQEVRLSGDEVNALDTKSLAF